MASFDPVTAAFEIGGKLLDRFFPDPQKRAEVQAELDKLKQSGDLARMANETETVKAYLSDTQSARDREAKIASSADAPKLNKLITPLLAIGVLVLTFIMFGLMVWTVDADINPGQKDIIIYILGVLSALSTQVVAYYFGSSRGDAAKDQAIREMLKSQ